MWPVSAQFKRELRADSHTVAIKAEVLDSLLQPVLGGTFYDARTASVVKTNQFQNIVVDGNVDIDVERDTQRTFELSILNTNGEFSPDAAWGGLFYVNRVIRLWRGLLINQSPEFVPIGTFMIDHADVVVERNMSTVVLSGSDQWKRFSKGIITGPGSYAAGTTYNSIISANAATVGISGAELSLDPLTSRTTAGKQLSKKRSYERGDARGDLIADICRRAGIDIYFDPKGVLTTQDLNTDRDKAVVWSFYDAEGGMLLSVRRSFSDDNLFNKVLCVGTGNSTTTYTASRAITDDSSPLSVNRIGERTKVIESRSWDSQTDVNNAVNKYWDDYRSIDEQVELEVICNPALEGNDVVAIRETNFTGMGEASNLAGPAYRISSMSIPLSSSRSKLTLKKVIHV